METLSPTKRELGEGLGKSNSKRLKHFAKLKSLGAKSLSSPSKSKKTKEKLSGLTNPEQTNVGKRMRPKSMQIPTDVILDKENDSNTAPSAPSSFGTPKRNPNQQLHRSKRLRRDSNAATAAEYMSTSTSAAFASSTTLHQLHHGGGFQTIGAAGDEDRVENKRFSMTSSTSHLIRRNSQQLTNVFQTGRSNLSKSFSTKVNQSLRSVKMANPNRSGVVSKRKRGDATKMFGVSIERLMERQSVDTIPEVRALPVPILVHDCVTALLQMGTDVEGIFRLSAPKVTMDEVIRLYDGGTPPSMHDMATRDPHVVTCVLKSFLRSLPEPLLTHDMYTKYIAEKNADDVEEDDDTSPEVIESLQESIAQLPPTNYNILKQICVLCKFVSMNSAETKMNEANLSIVFGPNFTWSPASNSTGGGAMDPAAAKQIMKEQILQNSLARRIFVNSSELFTFDDDEFNVAEINIVSPDGKDIRSPVKNTPRKRRKYSEAVDGEMTGTIRFATLRRSGADAGENQSIMNSNFFTQIAETSNTLSPRSPPCDEEVLQGAAKISLPASPHCATNLEIEATEKPLPPSPQCQPNVVLEAAESTLPESPFCKLNMVLEAEESMLPASPYCAPNVLLEAQESILPSSPNYNSNVVLEAEETKLPASPYCQPNVAIEAAERTLPSSPFCKQNLLIEAEESTLPASPYCKPNVVLEAEETKLPDSPYCTRNLELEASETPLPVSP